MGAELMQPLTLECDYENSKFYLLSMEMERVKILNVPADLEWAI
jgi:hypothetical protein